ncbi:tetratricopeptide repeat protein, partial [Polynucleobacter sp. JS-JIR-5-A7]|uniref:tetratricopeptide repeat protein n=1 Tax=Polynucleobacter sp. JS-JIR-5-A7 TaxID=1758395 RepID=UPI001BFEC91E
MNDINHFDIAKKYFLDGLHKYQLGFYVEAEELYLRSLDLLPNRISTLLNLSSTQIHLKKFNEAKSTSQDILKIEPLNYEAINNIGLIESKIDNKKRALTSYSRALEINPQYAEAWSNRGITLNDLKRFDEALSSYDRALEINPQYAEA